MDTSKTYLGFVTGAKKAVLLIKDMVLDEVISI